MFGGIFHDWLEDRWEVARAYLREELEQLYVTLNANWAEAFGPDNKLQSDVIDGDSTINTVYVSNEGRHHTPKWAKVNLVNGVKGRLPFSNIVTGADGTLVGVGTDSSSGDRETITLGDGLVMDDAELSIDPDFITALNGSFVPLVSGEEPLTFISDGMGNPILVEYNP